MTENRSSRNSLLRRVRDVKARNASRLKAYPNVIGVGIGYRVVGGKRTEEICIRVYVREKKTRRNLRSEDILPEEVEGVRVDVIEGTFNIHSVADHQRRHNPLVGGISIGNIVLGGSGTLGVSVFDNISREDMILSNWHVLCGRHDCAIQEAIIQPGAKDGGSSGDLVARLHRSVLTSRVDAAIARLTGNRFLLKEVLNLGAVLEMGTHSLGMRVRKSGRTTGVTAGKVVDENADVQIGGYPEGVREFRNQILIENGVVSSRGDSGSVWIDSSNRVIGLNFAGSDDDKQAIANPISSVLAALDINLKTGVTMHEFVAAISNLLH